jgi:uncharacterized membrane protein
MASTIKWFTEEEEVRIVKAIREAEENTSGEIRIHVENNLQQPPLAEALRVFKELEMHKTAARNGVLILLAPSQKSFAILGDEGIHTKVGSDFWQEEKELMRSFFARGAYADGLIAAIRQVGEKLKAFFPYQADDANELSDDLSYGS